MACTKWEEAGLLYTSGELTGAERSSYEQHLVACAECSQELRIYQAERRELFSVAMLEEQPSAAVDAEIVRVCGRRRYSGVSFLLAWAARPVFAALFFLVLGTGGGFYVAYQMGHSPVSPAIVQQQPAAAPVVVAHAADSALAKDTLGVDSASDGRPLARPSGAPAPGVMPVNLQQK
jgi:anti-sigma factor RsiW